MALNQLSDEAICEKEKEVKLGKKEPGLTRLLELYTRRGGLHLIVKSLRSRIVPWRSWLNQRAQLIHAE